jgi:hypothetical protein
VRSVHVALGGRTAHRQRVPRAGVAPL